MPTIAAVSGAISAASAAMAANGTWSFVGNGSWSVASNWAGGNIADGASSIADFSKLNIAADTTVNLDSPRTVGQLLFADTTQSNNWTLGNNGNAANILTLNNGASQPVITIGNTTTTGQITTIGAVLAGSNGFIKNGAGALQLTGANTFTGTVTLNSPLNGTGADLILGNNSALGASTNTLFIDPGSSNLTRVRLNAGVVISNPITLHTVRAPLQNGVLQTNGNVSATLSGPITIDNVVGSGGDISGPNDTTLTNFLTISNTITISNLYPPGNLTNANNNGVVIRTGNVILSGGGNYFRIEQRTGELRLGATNGIATNAYIDLGVNNGNPTTSFNSTLDLFGFNQTMVGVENLSQNGTVTNSANAPSTLTLTPGISAGQPTPPNLVFGGSIMSDAQATQASSLLNIVINGSASGMQTFNNASSSYHGSTSIMSGTLSVNTLANGGVISSIGASSSAASNLILGGGALRYTGGSVSTDRNFTLKASSTSTIDVSTAATTLTMTGAGTGGGGLTKAGAGTLVLTAAHAYTGNTTVSGGVLVVNGSLNAASNVSIASAATLAGSGTISGTVTPAAGGIISPGNSVGTITVGALTLNTGAQINYEFDGVNNDQVTVANPLGLTLNGGNLFLYNNGATSAYSTNGTYTLFNINGGFGGLVDNLTVSNPVAGKFYNITSSASVVSLTIGDATTIGWTNGNATNLWTDSGDWGGGVVPNAVGQTASFGAATGSGSVDMNGSKTVSGLIFNNSGTSYTIFGSGALTIDNGSAAGAITVSSGTHSVGVPVVLNGAVAVMTTNAADLLGVSGDISGAFPITVAGPGAVTLTGTNSFTTISVSASTLNVGAGGATGSLGSGSVTLSNNAVLNFNRNNAYSFGQGITGVGTVNQLGSGATTIGGAMNVTAVNVSSGALIASSTIAQSSGINVTGSGNLTANGAISGAGSLAVNTSGIVNLNAANSYAGQTRIDAGIVKLNAVGALPAGSTIAVNGGVLDLNAHDISITNILDLPSSTGVITNNGAGGTTSTINFTGNAAIFGANTGSYNVYAAINDGASGGKVALVSTINNVNLGTFSLALHAPSTYSGGTSITRQSVDAYATNALGTGTGSVVLQSNTASTNVTHLGIAGGVTLPNDITIVLPNAGVGAGAIQYITSTSGNATLTGAITVQADHFTGGTFAGPINGFDLLNINGPVTATGGTTLIEVRAGSVAFGGGGSYPQLAIYSNALLTAANGIAMNAVLNLQPDVNVAGGIFDLQGHDQTLAGLIGGDGFITSSSGPRATLTLNVASDRTYAGAIDGNLNLTKTGAATQTLGGFNTYSGNTTVSGGTLKFNGSNAWAPALSGPGTTDIAGSTVVFDYNDGSADPAATIQAILTASYGTGFATGQIHSSTAVANQIGLGWRDDTVAKQVFVRRALYGDADLSGTVDTVDFGFLVANFSQTGKVWADADFNYDGTVNSVDFNLMAANFAQGLAAPAQNSLGTLVPEPASSALIVMSLASVASRRRRRARPE